MLLLKRIEGPFDTKKTLCRVIGHIFTNNGNANSYIGGANVISPRNAAEEFLLVKRLFGKEDGNQLKYMIISADRRDLFTGPMMMKLGYMLCAYYAPRFQCVFSVHTNKENPHIQLVINSVSFVDGKKLHEGIGDIKRFESYRYKCYAKVKGKYKWVDTALRSF